MLTLTNFTSQHSTLGMRNFENNVGKVEMMVSGNQQFRYLVLDYLSILDYFNLDKSFFFCWNSSSSIDYC